MKKFKQLSPYMQRKAFDKIQHSFSMKALERVDWKEYT